MRRHLHQISTLHHVARELLIWTKGPQATSTMSPRHSFSQHFSASCLCSLVLAPVNEVFSINHGGAAAPLVGSLQLLRIQTAHLDPTPASLFQMSLAQSTFFH